MIVVPHELQPLKDFLLCTAQPFNWRTSRGRNWRSPTPRLGRIIVGFGTNSRAPLPRHTGVIPLDSLAVQDGVVKPGVCQQGGCVQGARAGGGGGGEQRRAGTCRGWRKRPGSPPAHARTHPTPHKRPPKSCRSWLAGGACAAAKANPHHSYCPYHACTATTSYPSPLFVCWRAAGLLAPNA